MVLFAVSYIHAYICLPFCELGTLNCQVEVIMTLFLHLVPKATFFGFRKNTLLILGPSLTLIKHPS